MTNWIADVNKFKLQKPPKFWLRQLQDFDPSLVVVPSRQDCVYRLCQRRPLTLPEHIVNDALFNQSDTQMLASYSLIPVTSMIAKPNWSNPAMFEELRRRAPHRNGGAKAVTQAIEAQEAKEELDRQIAINQITEDAAKDGWGMYLKKIGVRSNMYIPKTKDYERNARVAPMAPAIRIAK